MASSRDLQLKHQEEGVGSGSFGVEHDDLREQLTGKGRRIKLKVGISCSILILLAASIVIASFFVRLPGGVLISNYLAVDSERGVRERAAATWDLSSIPCRCQCPDGTSPPNVPPKHRILQSASDARKHRAITLPSGLKAFLTSDPNADFAAAAVDVDVGSADDPPEIPGLAHFLEHMLFMGSLKYPGEDDYSKFLTQNGGYANAYTADEHTNYFFKVRAEAFPEALDRLAQFFTAPLFREEAAAREVMAVDAEHHKNLLSDMWRSHQLRLSECGGRVAHFATGDRHSLRNGSQDVVQVMRRFHADHYVADNLRLSILGREPLNDLENLVRSAFEHVRQGTAVPKRLVPFPGPPLGVCAGGLAYVVEPVSDMQSLLLTFPAREMDSLQAKTSAVYKLLVFVLRGRHEGSLYADLKKHGWATNTDFGLSLSMADVSTMSIVIELTAAGLSVIPEVVDLALGHLRMLVETLDLKGGMEGPEAGDACRLWNEMEAVHALNFHFQEKSDPADFVSELAHELHTLPPRDVLGSSAASSFDPNVTASILRALDSKHNLPSLWIYAKNFNGGASLRNSLKHNTEPIYGTPYLKGPLPKRLVLRWSGAKAPKRPASAKLPADIAKYLPSRLALQPVPSDGSGERRAPPSAVEVSNSGAKYNLHYKSDAEYRVPKTIVKCMATAPIADLESPLASVEANMFSIALEDALEIPLYQATLAGYSFSVNAGSSGVALTISGYSGNNFETLSETIAAAIVNPPQLPVGRFEELRALEKRKTNSERHGNLYQVGRTYLSNQALSIPSWSWNEQMKALDKVTWNTAVKRIKALRSAATTSCLAYGDLSRSDARSITQYLASIVEAPSQVIAPLPAVTILPSRTDFTEIRSPPLVADETNSLVMLVYQLQPVTCAEGGMCSAASKQAAAMLLLSQIASERAANQLRTKETLGYVAWLWVHPSHVEEAGGKTVWSIRLLVQSGTKSAAFVRQRMHAFMSGLLAQFDGDVQGRRLVEDVISDADISAAKRGLIASLLKKPDTLASEGGRLWTEIYLRRYDWSRPWQVAAEVEKLTREDCVDVLRQATSPDSKVRKAAIEVWRSEDGDPFHDSNALHLEDAAAMRKWKKSVGNWSSFLSEDSHQTIHEQSH